MGLDAEYLVTLCLRKYCNIEIGYMSLYTEWKAILCHRKHCSIEPGWIY